MIYDLKELSELAVHIYKNVSDREGLIGMTNIAIAERLEALVEAQKPKFVEVETGSNCSAFINPQYVIDVAEFNEDWLKDHKNHIGCVVVTTTATDTDEAAYSVKGTLAEVMAKLRGEVTK